MILKSKGRRGASAYRNVARYITRDTAILKQNGKPVYLTWNVTATTLQDIIKEFQQNDLLRVQRSNSIKLTHEILSWSEKSAPYLNLDVFQQMFGKYVELRGENGKYFCVIHSDTARPHMHCMVSASEVFTGASMRMSKEEFQNALKKELQAFEKERFPQLKDSAIDYTKPGKSKSDVEYQIERRTGHKSRKEEVKELLETSYQVAHSVEEFYQRIEEAGLTTYTRGATNEVKGIDDAGRHMRLSTLGFSPERIEELQQTGNRLEELNELRQESVMQQPEEKKEDKLEKEEIVEPDDMPERS